MSTPLVSVVTPFHNTVGLLERCIRSVLAQDHPNIEYILMNNQSTDGSDEIAESYAQQFPQIRLHHTRTLLTQPANYNFALSQIASDSKYCRLVQADDWILPNGVSSMVVLAEQNPECSLIASYWIRATQVEGSYLAPEVSTVPGVDVGRLLLRHGIHLFGSPSVVMYRSADVRSRNPDFFRIDRLHEDTDAALDLLLQGRFGFVHQVLTVLNVDVESVSGRARRFMPELVDSLTALEEWGPRFLDEGELLDTLAQRWERYYRALSRRHLLERVRRRRDDAFWQYQSDALALMGRRLDSSRINRAVIPAVWEKIANPIQELFAQARHH
jgi:glycosyltransferase involved in cell wall biosynthesis